jgi:plastocyanin
MIRSALCMPSVFVMLTLVIAAIACGGSAAEPPEQEEADQASNAATGPVVVEIKEGGVPTRIEPEVIEVKKGSTLIFRFGGLDDQAHTFTANSLGLDLEVSGNETIETQPVTIDETGTIFFYCRFHRGIGGAGSIQVVE